jgi:hypothetical protein
MRWFIQQFHPHPDDTPRHAPAYHEAANRVTEIAIRTHQLEQLVEQRERGWAETQADVWQRRRG